jgi:5'(3')-deoxyribonucleotidase
MDEVIADAVAEHILRYNRDHTRQLCLDDLHGRHIWDAVEAEHHPELERYIRAEDFFADLAVMPESQRVLRRLSEVHEIFIASAAMEVPTSFLAKFRWLERHFPFLPPSHIVFCGDKSILHADYLIDDNPRQLRRFCGVSLLFSAPHNVAVTEFERLRDWLDVERYFFATDKDSSLL